MFGVELGIASVVLILVLIYAGIHVAVALGLVSFIGVWLYRDSFDVAVHLLAAATHDTIAHAVFANIPLFALMGIVASEIGLGADVYKVADQIFRRIRGGLGMATVAANALFASITGSSIASASVFTPHRRARDAALRLHAAVFGRRGGRQLGARHADPALLDADPLRHRGRAVGRPHVHRRLHSGHPAGHRLRAGHSGDRQHLPEIHQRRYRADRRRFRPDDESRRDRHAARARRLPRRAGAGRHLYRLVLARGGGCGGVGRGAGDRRAEAPAELGGLLARAGGDRPDRRRHPVPHHHRLDVQPHARRGGPADPVQRLADGDEFGDDRADDALCRADGRARHHHRDRVDHPDRGAAVPELGRGARRRSRLVRHRDRDRRGDRPADPAARHLLLHHQEHDPRPRRSPCRTSSPAPSRSPSSCCWC